MWILKFLTAIFGLFGVGRSPAVMLNLTAPKRGYRLIRDIPYSEGPRHAFDIYLPADMDGRAPVLLFFYGGAFRAGRKSEYRVVGEALASKGIIVAIADYRIYPEARFPNFLEDGARAFATVHARIAEFGGNPSRIFVAGHSAGAYIAVMLACNPAYLRAVNGDPAWIKGVIALAGRYHEAGLQDTIGMEIFGGPARDETRPAAYIKGKIAPMLLAAGSAENQTVLDSMKILAERLKENGSDVEEILYPNIDHMGIMLSLAPGFRGRATLRDDIVRFIGSH